MKKNALKCIICGGNINHNEVNQLYRCNKCNTEYAPEMFSADSSKYGKIHVNYPRLKIFFAILGALYLLYLTLRIFYY